MPDTATAPAATPTPAPVKQTPLPSITVNRSGVDVEFSNHEITRGEDKGTQYLAPIVNETNLNTIIAWITPSIVAKKIAGFMKQYGQGWWEDAIDEAATNKVGDKVVEYDLEKAKAAFVKLATDFSARGESISELNKQIEELVTSMTELDMNDPNWAKDMHEAAMQVKELKLAVSLKKRGPRTTEKTANGN